MMAGAARGVSGPRRPPVFGVGRAPNPVRDTPLRGVAPRTPAPVRVADFFGGVTPAPERPRAS